MPTPRPRRTPALAWLLMLLALTPLAGCDASSADRADADNDDGRLKIVATTGMLADLVRQVAGDHAEVVGMMGEGVDPHLYRPTRGDVRQLMDADVIVYNGLHLEGKMGDTLDRQRAAEKHVIALAETLDQDKLVADEEDPDTADPHVWMNVQLWSEAVANFADEMAEIDPANAEAYRANAQRYREQLAELDEYVREAIGSISEEQRVLVTAHDAFGYFGEAYDLEVRGVYGLSTDSEAGTHDINRLVDMVVERELPAVFAESSVSGQPVEAVIRGAESRGHEVRLGGQLFSDAMGATGTYEGTYIGMIDHNATTIARALGGEAPERGMNGRLGASE